MKCLLKAPHKFQSQKKKIFLPFSLEWIAVYFKEIVITQLSYKKNWSDWFLSLSSVIILDLDWYSYENDKLIMRQASKEKQLPKCKTDNFGQEPFTYDVSIGRGGKKRLTKSKNQKNREKIWLGWERGRRGQISRKSGWRNNVTFVAIKTLPLILLFPLTF